MLWRHVAILSVVFATSAAAQSPQPIVGLITKTETNPFFVKMKEGAQAAAKARGAKLLTGAGRNDADNAGQVTAMENMIAAGAQVILITVSDSKAIIPAIRRAKLGFPICLNIFFIWAYWRSRLLTSCTLVPEPRAMRLRRLPLMAS